MRKSPLLQIWNNDELIGLQIHCESATDTLPDRFEEEIVRIFNEHKRMKKSCWPKDAVFHYCTGGEESVRPYPQILCSVCNPTQKGKDFNAFDEFVKLQTENAKLRKMLKKSQILLFEIGAGPLELAAHYGPNFEPPTQEEIVEWWVELLPNKDNLVWASKLFAENFEDACKTANNLIKPVMDRTIKSNVAGKQKNNS